MSDTFQRTEEEVQALLLAACTEKWQQSSRAIAKAMVLDYRKYRDDIGGLFLEERLRELASSPGLFEIDDANLPFGQYNVRLARQSQA